MLAVFKWDWVKKYIEKNIIHAQIKMKKEMFQKAVQVWRSEAESRHCSIIAYLKPHES